MYNFGIMQQSYQPYWFNSTPETTFSVLVVEDDASLRHLLEYSLRKLGYEVYSAENGEVALELFRQREFHLLIIDIIMPVMDGFALCTEIRKISDLPVIMLTALNDTDDVVKGFQLGADDYITKPFSFREVEIRLHAIFRRVGWIENPLQFPVIDYEGFVFDEMARLAIVEDNRIPLTPIECKLLGCLMNAPNQPISKNELFRIAWGYEVAGGRNLVEVAMRRLRQKIELDSSDPKFLITVRSAGYKFVPPRGQAEPVRRSMEKQI